MCGCVVVRSCAFNGSLEPPESLVAGFGVLTPGVEWRSRSVRRAWRASGGFRVGSTGPIGTASLRLILKLQKLRLKIRHLKIRISGLYELGACPWVFRGFGSRALAWASVGKLQNGPCCAHPG